MKTREEHTHGVKLQNHLQGSRPWADSNHRSPVYETGALTTMLQSHATQRGIKKYIH